MGFFPNQTGPVGPKVHTDPIPYAAGIVAKAGTIFAPATAVRTGNAMYMCIAEHVTGASIDLSKWQVIVNDGAAGPTGPAAWAFPVDYASGIAAQAVAPSTVVIYGGETYVCNTAHTTGAVFDAAKWTKVAPKGADGTNGANGAGLTLPAYTSGRYFWPYRNYGPTAGTALSTANRPFFIPFTLDAAVTIDALLLRVRTAAAGGNAQLAIYGSNTSGANRGKPTGNPLATTGNISTATAAAVLSALSSSVTLPAGILWWGVVIDASATTATFDTASGNPFTSMIGQAATTIASSGPQTGYFGGTLTFGSAWPDLTSVTLNDNTSTQYAVPHLRIA